MRGPERAGLRNVARLTMAGALVTAGVLIGAQSASASWLDQTTPAVPGATLWSFTAVSCTSLTTCMAVGSDDSSDGLLAESRNGNNWTILSIPDPGNANLNSVSCTSTSACTAVGNYTSGSNTVTLAEAWNGSTWSVQSTANPAGTKSAILNRVVCTSASACIAVGDSTTGTTTSTLAEAWNGSTWTIQTTPNASGQANSQLNGLACTSSTNCTAVGTGSTGSNSDPLAETWNGSHWATQTIPAPTGTFKPLNGVSCTSASACTAVGDGYAENWNGSTWTLETIAKSVANLTSVSCETATVCTAVGYYYDDGVQFMIAESWNGTVWKVDSTPLSASFDSDELTDISCQNATTCTAVGAYHDPVDGNRALVEIMQLRWHPAQAAVPPGAIASSLDTLSCAEINNCMAVGNYEASGSTFSSLAETWDGHTWTVQNPPNATSSSLSGVSCPAPSTCTVVGDVLSGGVPVTLAEQWNGTGWTVQSTPNPAGAASSFLTSVSCPSAASCTATGFYRDGSGSQFTLAESWNGSSWTLQSTPNPGSGTSVQFNSVSCTATTCDAVGYYLTPSYTMLAEHYNGSTWTIESTPAPVGSTAALLNGVSCVSATNCTAVGNYDGAGTTNALAARWDGTSWSIEPIPNKINAAATFLSSVSCAVNGACMAVGSGYHSDPANLTPVAEHSNGSAWNLTVAPGLPANGVKGNFSSVSCVSGHGCIATGFYDDNKGNEFPLYAPFN
ncbi:MAG TPA: hypothetical protein VGS19_03615 [Streptosporangiaceae bacterium]|nr:hypothetical protein [Streptosporangiaceae bacterium]